MKSYSYTVIAADGARQKGDMMAQTSAEARTMIKAQGHTLISLSEQVNRFTRQVKISQKSLVIFTRQLASLLEVATPLDDALMLLAIQNKNSSESRILMAVKQLVTEGISLSAAMKQQQGSFPAYYCAALESAETSGKQVQTLERLADDLEARAKINRKIKGALAYPAVLTLVAFAVITVLLVAVVPKVVEQFAVMDQALPALTRFVLATSYFIAGYGLYILCAVAVMWLGFFKLYRIDRYRVRVDGFMLNLPLLGPAIKSVNAVRFCRTSAGLMDSGCSSLTALETAMLTCTNKAIQQYLRQAVERISEGHTIHKSLSDEAYIPIIVTHMLMSGEVSGKLSPVFHKAAEYLDDDFTSKTDMLLTLLEPMIIVSLSIIIFTIVAAIFMPILQLNTLAL